MNFVSRAGGHGHGHGGHAHGGAAPSDWGFVPQTSPSEPGQLERGAGRGKILFFDCLSGVSGDMALGALLDLGVPLEVVRSAIDGLDWDAVELRHERGHVGALGASRFVVGEPSQAPSRNYADIRRLLEASPLGGPEKELAQRIFSCLARAEARVHRMPLEEVEFHEVGAVDSIVDIVGVAVALEYLGASVVCSPLPLGRGFVRTQHGVLPLPAPATLECLVGVPTRATELEVELVTPTGAAIVATVSAEFTTWPSLQLELVGHGAGTRVLADRPNLLRVVLGERAAGGSNELASHAVLEANLDDLTGERAAFACARLLEAGALDAWCTPILMKKGRPGLLLSVLCRHDEQARFADILFNETSTLGVRRSAVSRYELQRRVETFETPYGPVRIKLSGDGSRFKLEFEDCARIARETSRPLSDIAAELEQLFRLKGARA